MLRPLYWWLSFFALVFLSGCHLLHVGKSASNNINTFSINFFYPGSGIGGTGNIAWILIPPNSEDKIVLLSIIQAVNDLHHTFVTLDIQEGLLPNKIYATDFITVEEDAIQKYNKGLANAPSLKLKEGPAYSLSYEIKYIIRERQIILDIQSILKAKGTLSNTWILYKDYYDRNFFSQILQDTVGKELSAIAKAQL